MDTDVTLAELARRYVDAHVSRIAPPEDGTRRLWASRPVSMEYRTVLARVREIAPAASISDKTVEDFTNGLLTAALSNGDGIDSEAAALEERLKAPAITRFYVPLDGIAIVDAEAQFGSVKLVRMDDDAFELLIVEPYAQIMRDNPRYSDAEAALIIQGHRERHGVMRGRTCVEIITGSDLEMTFATAERVIANICDFLQVCLASVTRLRQRNPVRWSNQVAGSAEISFAVMDGPERRSNSHASFIGGPPPQLDAASLETIESNGLLSLGKSLGADPVDEYDEILRRSIRWFAKGEREIYARDAHLAYVTAVELFFSSDDPGSTSRFCRGLAFALSEDPNEIVRLARVARHAYADRSDTSHAGTFEFERHDGLDQFRFFALQFLARMAQQPFTHKVQVNEWIASCEARLGPEHKTLLDDAIVAKAFKQDVAIAQAVSVLLEGAGRPFGTENERLRHVFACLLAEACHERKFLLDLRPLAHDLLAVVSSVSDPDARVVEVRHLLKDVDWVEDSLKERLASNFA